MSESPIIGGWMRKPSFISGRVLGNLGNYTGAITYLDRALSIDPNYKFALNNKGWALINLGNYKGAITYLDRALSIDPTYEAALSGKGRALGNLGNYKEAITYLDRALSIDPTDLYALKTKAFVQHSMSFTAAKPKHRY
jgi:tetratricopeptide (TPR) repeat protein